MVTPSMESPALRAFMVVVISAASVNKVNPPMAFAQKPTRL